MATPEIPEFFAALRGGDPRSVEELLRQFDPYLRRVIRLRLMSGRLSHAVDTTDILQSLLKDFLTQREKETLLPGAPGGLCAYLAAAVRNKVRGKLRKERRYAGRLPADWERVGPDPSPAEQAESRDLCQLVRGRLSTENRLLFDLKAQGLTWTQIAEKVSGQPDALRVGLSRAIAKILRELEDEE
jgi:DNA-directed RNA polymerase specialized sigma24 family protein